MKRIFFPAILILLFSPYHTQADPLKIKTVPAEKRLVAKSIEKTGVAIPGKTLRIASEVSGLLEKLNVDKGDVAKRGMVLADVDRKTALLLVEESKAMHKEVLVRKKLVDKPYRDDEIKIFQLKVDKAETEKKQAENDLQRFSKLFAEGHTSREQIDNAETKFQTAQLGVEIAKRNLKMAMDGSRVEEIQAAAVEVLKAQKSLNISQNNLKKTRVVSVEDGIISEKHVEEGEFVSAGQALLDLVVMDPVKISFAVSESELPFINLKNKIEFALSSTKDKFSGEVSFIAPVADSRTHLFNVEILVPNPNKTISPGMTATVNLGTNKMFGYPVKADWLRFHDKELGVFIISGGKVSFLPVTQRNYLAKEILLFEGVQEGDAIVTFASKDLAPGQIIKGLPDKLKKELVLTEGKEGGK